MNPVSPDAENKHSQQPKSGSAIHHESELNSHELDSAVESSIPEPIDDSDSEEAKLPAAQNRRWSDTVSPLENLQRRYTDQLSQDIEQLEIEKTRLQGEIATLKQNYKQLQAHTQTTEPTADLPITTAIAKPVQGKIALRPLENPDSIIERAAATDSLPTADRGPRLPGEKEVPPLPIMAGTTSTSSQERAIELPTPATSQQRRQQQAAQKARAEPIIKTNAKHGLILSKIGPWTGSAIATLITAWHYGLVGTLHQGGSWLGLDIGQLGIGFVPAVALLWLRMLVIVPAVVLLAPQLHRATWEDLLDWFYSPEQLQKRLFVPLIGSGVALFFSQVFLYQSMGTVGPAIGAALLFLYPLSAIPLGLALQQERAITSFGLLAIVAIAMGGLLVAKPIFTTASTAVGLGVLASLMLSLYIVLTNRCYRLHCHPIPTAIVQFSTVAVLSSLVLLVKPLKLVNISWLSFCLWGLLIGVLMLIAYLITYAGLLNIRSKTAIVAAATPIAALIVGLSFSPQPTLQIIQWTGIMLVAIGGIALGKEKLG